MIRLIRTNSENKDFVALVKYLDADLAVKDGEDHAFYAQFNKIDKIKWIVVAYNNNLAVGCGAIKEYEPGTVEIKRMYVSPEQRGQGIASIILDELEKWASELSFNRCILETGIKQTDAIRLYEKNNYKLIPNYGQYEGMAQSLCFEKYLINL